MSSFPLANRYVPMTKARMKSRNSAWWRCRIFGFQRYSVDECHILRENELSNSRSRWALKTLSPSSRLSQSHRMPSIRRNRRLRHLVATSNSNPAVIAVIPDPYPSDGPGVNYLVTRDLVADVDDYEHGSIDYSTLIARREIKWGGNPRLRAASTRLCEVPVYV
ncbi:hypothetical protein B0H14DRAFT_2641197 [Mycena olivaceomarginata]|nr:hypothetical protein B0H14DRAFT_2641197 [Mycena olivaceomarginata]